MKVVEFPVSAVNPDVLEASTLIPNHSLSRRVGVEVSLIDGATIVGSNEVKSPADFHPAILEGYRKLFGLGEIALGEKWVDEHDQIHTNGAQSCVMNLSNENGIVSAQLAQTGYFNIKAWQSVVHKALIEGRFPLHVSADDPRYEEEAFQFMLDNQPQIAGAGIYALCEYNGEICVVGQCKGPGTGHKQLHTSWVGRGIHPKFLSSENPVRAAQLENLRIETGIDPNTVAHYLTEPRMVINEPSTGNTNFISFLTGQPADFYLTSFRSMTSDQVIDGATIDNLKQAGLGFVPLQGLTLIPLEDLNRHATPRVYAVIPYLDVKSGKIVIPDEPQLTALANRPHSDGFFCRFADPSSLESLLKAALKI